MVFPFGVVFPPTPDHKHQAQKTRKLSGAVSAPGGLSAPYAQAAPPGLVGQGQNLPRSALILTPDRRSLVTRADNPWTRYYKERGCGNYYTSLPYELPD